MTDTDQCPLLEVCVDTVAGIEAAIAGGADRIELCSALALGGLTPSAGLARLARATTAGTGVALHAMVRPRAGDFAYDPAELALATAEALALIDLGVDGLVFGAVRHGQIDHRVASAWIEAVRGAAGPRLPCVFHRAIDIAADPVAAVSDVASLGFDAILTSGGAVRAADGASTIRAMVERARDTGLTIMAGAGVTPANVAHIVAATGCGAVHASASIAGDDPAARLRELGFATDPLCSTDRTIVAAFRSALDKPRQMEQ